MPLQCELVVGLFFLEIPSYKATFQKTGAILKWLKRTKRPRVDNSRCPHIEGTGKKEKACGEHCTDPKADRGRDARKRRSVSAYRWIREPENRSSKSYGQSPAMRGAFLLGEPSAR